MNKAVRDIITNPEFQKLREIGGGKQYHQEGDVLTHSLLVYHNSFEFWGNPQNDITIMNVVALLHDVGKIYTGRVKENGDWEYPNHAHIGAASVVSFLPQGYRGDNVPRVKWLVANHIKPLFWKEFPEFTADNVDLAKLAICDLKASFSEEPQEDKIEFLYSFINEYEKIQSSVKLFTDEELDEIYAPSEDEFWWNK